MSGTITSMLFFAVFVLVIVVTFRLLIITSTGHSDAIREAASIQSEQLQTRISIASTEIEEVPVGVGRCFTTYLAVDADVENTGQKPISRFSEMDLMLDYTGYWGSGTAVRPEYVSTGPSEGQWAITAIDPGVYRPDIWDPDETMSIRFRPALLPQPQSLGRIVVSTPSGVSHSAYVNFGFEAPVSNDCRYLHNNPTPPVGDTARQPDGLPMDTTIPTATTTSPFYNYDVDAPDGNPGRSISKGGSGPDESDPGQYQTWTTGTLSTPLHLLGTIAVDLWSQGQVGSGGGTVTVFFRDLDGGGYTEIGQGTIYSTDWQGGVTDDFVRKVILVPGFDYTVPAGHELEIKLIVDDSGASELWFAYDTETRQSLVNLSYVEPPYSNVFYLHNNPTPPVGDTNHQDVLPMDTSPPTATTLYKYDELTSGPGGRELQGTAQGLSETNWRKKQVWRSGPLAGEISIVGDVTIEVWAGSDNNFAPGKTGIVTLYLRDYNGADHTEIGNASVYADDWQGDDPDWVRRLAFIPEIDYTIPAGNELELFLVVDSDSDGNMWIAYDTVTEPATYLKLP